MPGNHSPQYTSCGFPASNDEDPAAPASTPETSFDPLQLELPGLPTDETVLLEWRCPVTVLTDYLGVVGVSRPGEVARLLLDDFGSLSELLGASWWRLRWVAGNRLADVLRASRNLLKTRLLESVREGPIVPRTRDLIDFLQAEIGFLRSETLLALYVDPRARLIRIEHLGEGHLRVVVEPRTIIERGLAIGASGLVLVHNHPSGIPQPSKADLALTSKLRELAAELDLHLLDHLIIARGRVASIYDYWREAEWNGRVEQQPDLRSA